MAGLRVCRNCRVCKAVGAKFLLQKLQLFAQCSNSFLQTHSREERQWQMLGDPRVLYTCPGCHRTHQLDELCACSGIKCRPGIVFASRLPLFSRLEAGGSGSVLLSGLMSRCHGICWLLLPRKLVIQTLETVWERINEQLTWFQI